MSSKHDKQLMYDANALLDQFIQAMFKQFKNKNGKYSRCVGLTAIGALVSKFIDITVKPEYPEEKLRILESMYETGKKIIAMEMEDKYGNNYKAH